MNRRRHDKDFIPRRIQQNLLRDPNGRFIPFFVRYIDNVPDFRFIDARMINRCVLCGVCWVCGLPLPKKSQQVGFTLTTASPMRRFATEPPSHPDCAVYAARVWPMTLKRLIADDEPTPY